MVRTFPDIGSSGDTDSGTDDDSETDTQSPTQRRAAYEERLSEEYTDEDSESEPEPEPEPEQPARGIGGAGTPPIPGPTPTPESQTEKGVPPDPSNGPEPVPDELGGSDSSDTDTESDPEPEQPARGRGDSGSGPVSVGPPPEPQQPTRGRGDESSGPESVGPPPEPEQPTRGRGDSSSGPSSTAPEETDTEPTGSTSNQGQQQDTELSLDDLPSVEELENQGDGLLGQETVKPDRATQTGTTRDDLQEQFEDARSDLIEDPPQTVADFTGDTYSTATDLVGEGYGVATEVAADTQALQNIDNTITAIAAAEEEAGEPLTGPPGELEQTLGEKAGDLGEASGDAKDWADKYIVDRGVPFIAAALEPGAATSQDEVLTPDTPIGQGIENFLGGASKTGTSIVPGGVEAAVNTVDTAGDATETLVENVEEEGTAEGLGESGETAAQLGGQIGSAAYEQATENPLKTAGGLAADFLAGAGIAKGLEKASDVSRGVRIARQSDSDTVDYGDTTTKAGTEGELPDFDTDPGAPTREAVEEIRERARDNPDEIKPGESEGAIYHTTQESLPGDLEVGEGGSELPGLFGSPDASPIGLSGVGGDSGYSLGIRLPDIRGSSDEIVSLPGDDVRGIPRGKGGSGYELRDPDTGEQVTGGLGRGEAKSMAADTDLEVKPDQTTSGYEFLTEQAEEGGAYVRPSGQRTTELEAIYGPGSEFVEEGVTPVRIGGTKIPGTDVTIPGTGRVVPGRRFTRTGDSDTDVGTGSPDAPDSDVSPTAYDDLPTSQLSDRSGTPVGPPPGVLSPSTTTTTGETTQSTGRTPTSTWAGALDSALSSVDSQIDQVTSDLESSVNDATDILSGLSDSSLGGLTGGSGTLPSDGTQPPSGSPPSDTTPPTDTTPTPPTSGGPTSPPTSGGPTEPPTTDPPTTPPTDTTPTSPPGETTPPGSGPPTSGPPDSPPGDTTPPSSPPSSGPPTSEPPATTPPTSPPYTPSDTPTTNRPRFDFDTENDDDEDEYGALVRGAQKNVLSEFVNPLTGEVTETPENPGDGFLAQDGSDDDGFNLW